MKIKAIVGAIAALAVITAGIYAINSDHGNLNAQIGANNANAAVGASCEASIERGKTLNEAATGQLAAFRPLDDPLDMKELAFYDRDGNAMSLAEWNGKFVLFNLWATWCPPCREEMPWLDEMEAKRGGDNFQVVPVSIDIGDGTKPKQFYEQAGLKHLPFMQDGTSQIFFDLKKKAVALGMPTTLIVDTNGCGLGVLNGPAHWASPDAFKLIDATLALGKI